MFKRWAVALATSILAIVVIWLNLKSHIELQGGPVPSVSVCAAGWPFPISDHSVGEASNLKGAMEIYYTSWLGIASTQLKFESLIVDLIILFGLIILAASAIGSCIGQLPDIIDNLSMRERTFFVILRIVLMVIGVVVIAYWNFFPRILNVEGILIASGVPPAGFFRAESDVYGWPVSVSVEYSAYKNPHAEWTARAIVVNITTFFLVLIVLWYFCRIVEYWWRLNRCQSGR
jgi:hypothetical protein